MHVARPIGDAGYSVGGQSIAIGMTLANNGSSNVVIYQDSDPTSSMITTIPPGQVIGSVVYLGGTGRTGWIAVTSDTIQDSTSILTELVNMLELQQTVAYGWVQLSDIQNCMTAAQIQAQQTLLTQAAAANPSLQSTLTAFGQVIGGAVGGFAGGAVKAASQALGVTGWLAIGAVLFVLFEFNKK